MDEAYGPQVKFSALQKLAIDKIRQLLVFRISRRQSEGCYNRVGSEIFGFAVEYLKTYWF